MQYYKDKANTLNSMCCILLTILSLVACKKFVDIPAPENELVSQAVFESDATAIASVNGIYSEMMSANMSNQFTASGITLTTGLYSDELTSYLSSKQEFVNSQISEANHNYISINFWDRAYKFIYTANLCIEQLNRTDKVTRETKKQLIGECKFIRTFCFFHLVNLFGDVPLTLVTDYRVTSVMPRTASAEVYQQIINDLIDAKASLRTAYPSEGKIKPNSAAASALLARVYLYRQNWQLAETESNTIIESHSYNLVTNLQEVFLKNSPEAIWQLMPVSTVNNTWEGNLIIPASNSSTPAYILTQGLLNDFEPNDLRRANWVASRIYQAQTIYYPLKYKIKSGSMVTEYYMVLRLAEQYLIRAEARIQQHKLEEAVTDLNIIRNRAGLPPVVAGSEDQIRDLIEHERRIELFAEWGNRWYDLKRGGHIQMTMSYKPGWNSTDTLWPVPSAQIRANPRLIQNPGY